MHIVWQLRFSDEGDEPFSYEEVQVRYNKEWLWLQKDEYILLQYTGLKDKNNKEIYEGDIVHSKWVDIECQCGEEYTGIITYEKGAFWLQTTLDGYDTNWLEVIGNIHENPELLEEK